MDERIRWGYSTDEKTESWEGSYLTREAAIDAAFADYPERDTMWIQEGRIPQGVEVAPDADDILETMGQTAYENWGEASAEDWPNAPDEAKEELTAFIVEWVQKHVDSPTGWTSEGEPEEVTRTAPVHTT
jgi:hypothetical protein